MKKTISQLQYEFAQECKNKKYHFKKSEEQSAFDRYQRDLSGVSLRAEKKYQSWLRTAQLKHNTSLSLIDSQPVIKVEKKKKDPTLPPKLQAYEKISDSVASILCRVKKMDGSGLVKCTTCDASAYFWQGPLIGAGHFIKRTCKPIRWSKDNIRPQCFPCNDQARGNGKTAEMKYALLREIGSLSVIALETIETVSARKDIDLSYYPRIPRHKEYIPTTLKKIEDICQDKGFLAQLEEMNAYKVAKKFAEKRC